MDGYAWAVVFLLILMCVAALLRCYSRIFLVKKFGKDDVATIATLICAVGYHAIIIELAVLTDNQNLYYVQPQNIFPAINCLFAAELLYVVSAGLLKVALGLLLLRLLVKRWQRLVIYCTIAVPVIYTIFYFFFILFQCGNPSQFSTKIVANECQSKTAVSIAGYVHAALNCICDWIFGVMPIIFLWDAQMGRRAKISIAGILALGAVGSIATIIRIGWFHQITNVSPNVFRDSQGIGLMSAIELSVGITCACLPTYKPFFSKGFFGSRASHYYYYSNTNPSTGHGNESRQDAYGERRFSQPLSPLGPFDKRPQVEKWQRLTGEEADEWPQHNSWPLQSGAEPSGMPYHPTPVLSKV